MTLDDAVTELTRHGMSPDGALDVAIDAMEHGDFVAVESAAPSPVALVVRDESDTMWTRWYNPGPHGWRCTFAKRGRR